MADSVALSCLACGAVADGRLWRHQSARYKSKEMSLSDDFKTRWLYFSKLSGLNVRSIRIAEPGLTHILSWVVKRVLSSLAFLSSTFNRLVSGVDHLRCFNDAARLRSRHCPRCRHPPNKTRARLISRSRRFPGGRNHRQRRPIGARAINSQLGYRAPDCPSSGGAVGRASGRCRSRGRATPATVVVALLCANSVLF
jgi:hypothetical protein